MVFSINDFKAQFPGGGARPNLFRVNLSFPTVLTGIGDVSTLSSFMIKTASIPGQNVNAVPVPYFGRQIKYAGDRTFEPWTVTIINDEGFEIRNAMEAWSNLINSHKSNLRSYPTTYKMDGSVIQYGKNGTELRRYKFEGLFPTNVEPVTLGWEQNDAIEEFSTTFEYDLWDLDGGATVVGNPIT